MKSVITIFCLLVLPAVLSFAGAIPEPTVTRTHLMKDIDAEKIVFGFGLEMFQQDPEPPYLGEFYFAYCGYPHSDWLEYGIAVHSISVVPFPMVELKFDPIDIFTDSRFSLLLMGGLGAVGADQQLHFVYHGGTALNFRYNEKSQLYAGVGSDSLSQAWNVQAGVYVMLLEWLGVSANFKLVSGSEGIEPMASIAPLAIIRLKE